MPAGKVFQITKSNNERIKVLLGTEVWNKQYLNCVEDDIEFPVLALNDNPYFYHWSIGSSTR